MHHIFMKLDIRKALMNLHMPVTFDFWKILIWTPQGHFSCPPGVQFAISSKLLDEGESFLCKIKGQLMGFISATFDFWKSSLHAPQGVNFLSPRGPMCYNFMFDFTFFLFFPQDNHTFVGIYIRQILTSKKFGPDALGWVFGCPPGAKWVSFIFLFPNFTEFFI